jgi:DegV family protein with EDD domain
MPSIRVITDSTCDLPEAVARQYNITVIPVNVHVGRQTYLDRVTITTEQYLQQITMQSPAPDEPGTSAPKVEVFEQVYRQIQRERTADGIVAIHLSARLSSTCQAALAAREAFGMRSFPVAVIDSQAISMGLGLIVLQAARAAQAGAGWTEVVNTTQRALAQTHVAFFVDSIEPLHRTGRVPRLSAQLDLLLPLKPLLRLDNGQVILFERTRTRYKALDALYTFVEDFPAIETLVLMHSTNPHEVEALANRISTAGILSREQIEIVQYGPAITSAIGPGAIGVAVYEGDI